MVGTTLSAGRDFHGQVVPNLNAENNAATGWAIMKLRSLSEQSDEVVMVFGFNLSAHFGAIIDSTSAKANY